jgi:hypothetical protein
MHHRTAGPPGRYPVQPSTPLGPDQVNVLLLLVELITFTWSGKGTRKFYTWGIQSSEGVVRGIQSGERIVKEKGNQFTWQNWHDFQLNCIEVIVNLKELVPIFWFQFIYLAFKLETDGQKLVISQNLTMIRSSITDTIRNCEGHFGHLVSSRNGNRGHGQQVYQKAPAVKELPAAEGQKALPAPDHQKAPPAPKPMKALPAPSSGRNVTQEKSVPLPQPVSAPKPKGTAQGTSRKKPTEEAQASKPMVDHQPMVTRRQAASRAGGLRSGGGSGQTDTRVASGNPSKT